MIFYPLKKFIENKFTFNFVQKSEMCSQWPFYFSWCCRSSPRFPFISRVWIPNVFPTFFSIICYKFDKFDLRIIILFIFGSIKNILSIVFINYNISNISFYLLDFPIFVAISFHILSFVIIFLVSPILYIIGLFCTSLTKILSSDDKKLISTWCRLDVSLSTAPWVVLSSVAVTKSWHVSTCRVLLTR